VGAAGIWAGSRFFDGRSVRPIPVLAAPSFWALACVVPSFADDPQLRIVLMSTLMAMLTAATAEEIWRGRAEPLISRWPTLCAPLAYAAALLARIPAALLSPLLEDQSLMSGISFALLAFGTLLFTVVVAFLLLNMSKERSELKHKIASMGHARHTADVRPRSFQIDQRPVWSRDRRRRFARFRGSTAHQHARKRFGL
jgi:hypothetical protein